MSEPEFQIDKTDESVTYSAASEMRADGCALAYWTFTVVFLVVIPEGGSAVPLHNG
jgi:hypothetical protein